MRSRPYNIWVLGVFFGLAGYLFGPFLLAPALLAGPAAQAQCGPWGCSGSNLGPAKQPPSIPANTVPGLPGGCTGGQCTGAFGGLPGQATSGLTQNFQPFGGLLGQRPQFLGELLTQPLTLAALAASIAIQQFIQSLFGPGGPDITTVDPKDPRGQAATRKPSLRARRGVPPAPIPGEFRVECLEQRGLVEENPPEAQVIVPTKEGPGAQQGEALQGPPPCWKPAPGQPAPAPPPPAQPPKPPPAGCPGGVCPRR